MGDILLTQAVTRVERVTYSREQAIELLELAGHRPYENHWNDISDKDVGSMLADIANHDNDDESGLYERLVDDAKGSGEVVDVGEWEVTEIYGDAAVNK